MPHLAAAAQHLYVFQRTPSSVDVRANRPTDPQWANTLQPGWQRKRIQNFQILTAGGQADEDLVADAWTSITRKLPVMRHDRDAARPAHRDIEVADFAKMEEIRARVDEIVADRATAEALKPWYGYFCKRPCFHDEYLQTFNRDNVTLVDTRGRGVERITEAGVVVDGATYELDCLIFATGFEVGTDYCRRTGFELIGRDGVTLTDRWRDGVRTFQGLCANGFPNCFIESIAQAGLTVNFPYLLDVQASHAAWIIAWALDRGVTEVEASAGAEAAWVDTVVARSTATAERAKTCTPGYYNREGKADAKTRQGSFFFGAPTEYADILAAWRANGDMEGLEIRAAESGRDRPASPSAVRGRTTAGGYAASTPTEGGDHRRGLRRPRRGGGAAPRRHRRPGDHRGRRRRRRNLAAQHLSRRRLRHPESPVLVFVRAQPVLEPHLRSAARDSGLPGIGRRRLRSAPPSHARHQGPHAALECGHPGTGTAGWTAPGQAATLTADVVVCAVGLFGSLKQPDIEGLADFGGTVMHTAQWDHTVELAGKRVAVVGTGASGVQVVPELAKIAERVTVFQRTPPWMVPKDDRPYSATELAQFRRNPLAVRRTRWQIWKFQHDNTATIADDPVVAARTHIATSFLERTVADERLRVR